VSGGIVGVLVAFGVGADVALASVLAYRSVAIWLPAGIGLATIPSLRATLARWKAEDVLGSAEHWQNGAERRSAGSRRPAAPAPAPLRIAA
jgi:Zn-dependent alcohol dehydrogenase